MNISRRNLLGFALAFTFVEQGNAKAAPTQFNAYVTINPDNSIVIQSPAAEMGQGINTTLPLIIAEEMDADWSRVRIEQAPILPAFNHPIFRSQFVVASLSTRGYWMAARTAGAQARRMLLDAAALKMGVDVATLNAKNSVITAANGRKMSYGEVASTMAVPTSLPEIKPEQLKNPANFTLIGKDVQKFDLPHKTQGKAIYSIDIKRPNMLYATVYHAPALDSKPLSGNYDELKKLAGVTHAFALDNGIALVGKTYEAVLNARGKLKATWSEAKASKFSSIDAMKANIALVQGDTKGTPVKAIGEPSAFQAPHKWLTGEFTTDYVYHAQMEPLNAVADVRDDSVEIWAGTQWPTQAIVEAAKITGISADNVKLNPLAMGGGFGRRAYNDYVIDAVKISKAVKAPVKVINSREEDVRNGHFRPMTAHKVEFAIDSAGKIQGVRQRLAADVVVPQLYGQARMDAQKNVDHIVTLGLDVGLYGAAHLADHVIADYGVRTAAYRGIGYGANTFPLEVMVDEAARNAKEDALGFRLAHIKDPRAKALLTKVGAMAEWNTKGRLLGLAIGKLGLPALGESMAATIVEIAIDKAHKIMVKNIWCAADCGLVIQPANAKAQIEGALVWGVSAALKERISIKNGEVEQQNFFDYEVLRMSETPMIKVELVPSGVIPLPVGELGHSTVMPAIANAFASATGKALRNAPFLPERVKTAMV
jgi:isoquinoline 1-oxidoreductase subunit beta